MSLLESHRQAEAIVAADGIPLHYGSPEAEYAAALNSAILLDRSHEGRITLMGDDRYEFINRMSTNHMLNMAVGEGRSTVFLNANARILERVTMFHRGDDALIITEPGRASTIMAYLERNIFFKDQVRLHDISPITVQMALHGPQADAAITRLGLDIGTAQNSEFYAGSVEIADTPVFVARTEPVTGSHWEFIVPAEHAEQVWNTVLEAGSPLGLKASGGIVYNALRIRAGRPATGRELTQDYIPLETGLWSDVSFNKGCYTGQEIIARMESHNKLAKTIVRLQLDSMLEAPAELLLDGRSAGTLTSSVLTPDQHIIGIGIVKVQAAVPGQILHTSSGVMVRVIDLPGSQPPMITQQEKPA